VVTADATGPPGRSACGGSSRTCGNRPPAPPPWPAAPWPGRRTPRPTPR